MELGLRKYRHDDFRCYSKIDIEIEVEIEIGKMIVGMIINQRSQTKEHLFGQLSILSRKITNFSRAL